MGIIFNEHIEKDCLLGKWEIEEDFDTLMHPLTLEKEEISRLDSFRSHSRKLEWLSVRNLINTMTRRNCRIVYNAERKPFLHDNSFHISISHSHKLTAILMSKHRPVGIDLEWMSDKIKELAHRFINEREYISSDSSLKLYHLYIHWCAKEAIYKICDKQDINFKQNILVDAFEPDFSGGTFSATMQNSLSTIPFTLHYQHYKNYVIVYVYQ